MQFCWKINVTDEVPVAVDVPWKDDMSMGWNQVQVEEVKVFYLESLC